MTEPSDPIARAAAAALTARFDPALPMEVEKLILQRDAGQPPERYLGVAEGVAIAALILQCAQFAWQVYKDTREKDAIRRRLRLEVRVPAKLTPDQRDAVIEAVVKQLG
jgi:hypothetical protein